MRGTRPFTDDEIEQISTSFEGRFARRDRAIFLLGLKSGFRISELLSLRISDLIQRGRLVDRVTVHRRHMKKRTEGRTVLLHPVAKSALTDWIDTAGAKLKLVPDSFVFQSRKGENKPITRVQFFRILARASAANGITGRLGTHSMRKTFANKIYEKLGGDLVKTQRALGHRNVNSTVQYLSFREAEIDEAILAI